MLLKTHLGIEAIGFLLIAATAILTALAFQHIGGYIPCKLCLGQRIPYYTAIPVAIVACLMVWRHGSPRLIQFLFALLTLIMVYSVYLGVRHSGVEWGWWAGPGDCGAVDGNMATDTTNLLKQLSTTRPPSCDIAAGRFLGLSFAGWNVVSSLALLWIALRGAFGKTAS
ncbi:MAG: disulfide bond formation protein B [Rhizobiaceae bacterium]|nr:disulfide bond formation protein B [Rhizobiaceae bacterium]